MTHLLAQADAARMPLADASVDLIVTSPPYFALRSYRDGGEHYDGQIGAEPTPGAFLEALWAVMAECWRVLKPSGSCFINLGDKRAGSGGHNNSNLARLHQNYDRPETERHQTADEGHRALRRNAPDRYNQSAFGRTKSKMLLPHRFAIGCEDGLADPEGIGWIVRGDYVWQKLNGLPESVTDRCRDSHEYLFHLTKEGRYFSAVDEVRESYNPATAARYAAGYNARAIDTERPSVNTKLGGDTYGENPLGKLPGSVWALPSEPLVLSDEVRKHYDLPDHFAAFPTELVRRVVLGWSPAGVCVKCGEGRQPVVGKKPARDLAWREPQGIERDGRNGLDGSSLGCSATERERTITGYACACTPRTDHTGKRGDWKEGRTPSAELMNEDWGSHGKSPRRPGSFGPGGSVPPPETPRIEFHFDGWTPPATRQAVVLDPFSGTGTTVGVARALGRIGVGLDLSHDYCRLGRYFVTRSTRFAKVAQRTHRENQTEMFASV